MPAPKPVATANRPQNPLFPGRANRLACLATSTLKTTYNSPPPAVHPTQPGPNWVKTGHFRRKKEKKGEKRNEKNAKKAHPKPINPTTRAVSQFLPIPTHTTAPTLQPPHHGP